MHHTGCSIEVQVILYDATNYPTYITTIYTLFRCSSSPTLELLDKDTLSKVIVASDVARGLGGNMPVEFGARPCGGVGHALE